MIQLWLLILLLVSLERGLQDIGFEVQRVKGFGNKKHMTQAIYRGHVKSRMSLQPWFQVPPKSHAKKVAVVGAGMAGLNCAWSLSRLGAEVTVFDKASQPATGASGNLKGMMFPLISKKPDRLGTLTEAGSIFSMNQFNELGLSYKSNLLEFAT